MSLKVISTADQASQRITLFLYGEKGAGKTRLATQFPRPLLLIDTERGSDRLAAQIAELTEIGITDFDFSYSSSWKDITETLQEVASGRLKSTDGRPYATIVIDSLTTLYISLLTACLERDPATGIFNKATNATWFRQKTSWEWLGSLIGQLPCNVVCTAHTKDMLQTDSKGGRTNTGIERPHMDDSILYYFDLVLEMFYNQETNRRWAKLSPFKPDRNGRLLPNHVLKETDFSHIQRIFFGSPQHQQPAQPASVVGTGNQPEPDPEPVNTLGYGPTEAEPEPVNEDDYLGGYDAAEAEAEPGSFQAAEDHLTDTILDELDGPQPVLAPYKPGPKVISFLKGYQTAETFEQFKAHTLRRDSIVWSSSDMDYLRAEAERIFNEKGLKIPARQPQLAGASSSR